IQFGDSKALQTMNPTLRVTSSDGRMMGAHIADPSNEWVVMFSHDPAETARTEAVRYSFAPQASSSQHLVLNLIPGTAYYVSPTATAGATSMSLSTSQTQGAVPVTSDESGALHFTLSGLSVVAYERPLK